MNQATTYDVYYGVDEIKDWDPQDKSGSHSFTVSLYPPAVAWTFDTGGAVDLDVSADTVDDWVKWSWDDALWGPPYMPDRFHTEPGMSWFSFGTYAYLPTNNEIRFCRIGYHAIYNCQWKTKSWILSHNY